MLEEKRRHLVKLFPANGAVALLAQHPHLGGAAVTHRVIAFPHRVYIDVLAAQHARALCVFLLGGFHDVKRHWSCVVFQFSLFNPCGFGRAVNDSTGSEAG